MNLEKQVCSLELAKRLKELGVKQESIFYWEDPSNNTLFFGKEGRHPNYNYLSAFTVAELGEMLKPHSFIGVDTTRGREIWAISLGFKEIVYRCDGIRIDIFGENEADTRARMLINLIENKLITV